MWKNIVERGRPQVILWLMLITCWIRKDTNVHSVCVILITFPLQQLSQKRVSILRLTYIARLVGPNDHPSPQFPNIGHGNYSSGSEIFSLQVLPSVVDILVRQAFSKIEFYRNLKNISE
jgi:hypothetical protein